MKIAIYGDSFGTDPIGVKDYSLYPYVEKSWWEMLSQKYQVTNYCEWSASLLFSLDQFIKTHQNYDKVIFLVTHPRRISLNDNGKFRHFVNYEYSTLWKQTAKKEGWSNILDAVLNYFKYIEDESYSNLQHNSYLNYIKTIRSDITLIPCFEDSFENNFCLFDIFNLEQQHWKIDYDVAKLDIRKGHLTNPNHKLLYKIFDNLIQTGKFDANIEMFTQPDLPKYQYIL